MSQNLGKTVLPPQIFLAGMLIDIIDLIFWFGVASKILMLGLFRSLYW